MTINYLKEAARLLRPVPNFPKEGIMFWDLQPILDYPEVVDFLASQLAEYWAPLKPEVIAGFDSRGFLIGPLVAQKLGLPFRMIRKKGKLAPPTEFVSYDLEYGSAEIEMSDDGFIDGKRVLLIDDLLATGGTALAGDELVRALGGIPIGFTAISELPELGGRLKLLDIPVFSLITIMENTPLIGTEYCVDMYTEVEDTGDLVLIERLGDVPGLAMPGGRIDPRESAYTAVTRELTEETGLTAITVVGKSMLTGIKRDPRGPKVSIVFMVRANYSNKPIGLIPEPGKTRPFAVAHGDTLPPLEKFVFGHGQVVHDNWQTKAAA